ETRFDPERRFPDPRDIPEICPGLVIATEAAAGDSESMLLREQMQLAHYSVKEFLVSKRIQALAPSYGMRQAEGNLAMAKACIAYLLSFNKLDSIYPGVLEEFPLAEYASQNWIKHANVAAKGGALGESLLSLIM